MTRRSPKSDLVPDLVPSSSGNHINDLVPGSRPFRDGGTGNRAHRALPALRSLFAVPGSLSNDNRPRALR